MSPGQPTAPSGPAFERVLIPLLYRSQLPRLLRRLTRRVVLVTYHGFTTKTAHAGIENHEKKHLDLPTFEEHLAFLAAQYSVLPLQEVCRAMSNGAALPDRTAVITIDDGYRSIHQVAFPALRRLGLPASVFLATEFVHERRFLWTDRVEYAINSTTRENADLQVGEATLHLDFRTRDARMAADRQVRSALKARPQDERDRLVDALEAATDRRVAAANDEADLYQPLRWDEVREMAASGLMSFGSHTHTHVILSRCTAAHAAQELAASKAIIERELGRPCDTFCYPNGRRGDFNAITRQLLKDHGFINGLTTVYGSNRRDADVYELRRYNLGKPMMRGEIEVRLSGIMDVGSLLKA